MGNRVCRRDGGCAEISAADREPNDFETLS